MPQTSTKEIDKNSSPTNGGVGGDDALREDWKKLSSEDQDRYFSSLSAQDQVKFAQRVGFFDSKEPIKMSPPPKTGTIPWMKQKAYSMISAGANYLPTIEGALGGMAGAVVGEAVEPAGGGTVGEVIGSGVGGAKGEFDRQQILDTFNLDPYEEKTSGKKLAGDMAVQGAQQAVGGATGLLAGKWLRPTFERSLAKLYYAGGINYGDPLGPGELETVMNDLMQTEKSTGKATTVRDLIGVIKDTKDDIGQQVDRQFALPFKQNGKVTTIGKAEADTIPIVNAIQSKAIADPSIMKEARLNKSGKEAAYLEKIRQEALKFSREPWTYEELTSKRIRLNNELAPLYTLPAGEQRVYLLEHPELAFKKAEADAIREVVYPQLDKLSGYDPGTTEMLQRKRGALMSLENQVTDHLGSLKTKARQAKGAPPMDKVNISSYGTSEGKPGFAFHRITGLVHTPNPEAKADRQVAKAFGNTVGTKVRGAITTPMGSTKLGNEILSMPLRLLVNPAQPDKTKDNVGPQSSVVTPKTLIDKAKQMNNEPTIAYNHVAVNPSTGHKVVSRDGVTWIDPQTGQQVA